MKVLTHGSRRKMEKDANRMVAEGYELVSQSGDMKPVFLTGHLKHHKVTTVWRKRSG